MVASENSSYQIKFFRAGLRSEELAVFFSFFFAKMRVTAKLDSCTFRVKLTTGVLYYLGFKILLSDQNSTLIIFFPKNSKNIDNRQNLF